jgi:hypothetical protein
MPIRPAVDAGKDVKFEKQLWIVLSPVAHLQNPQKLGSGARSICSDNRRLTTDD